METGQDRSGIPHYQRLLRGRIVWPLALFVLACLIWSGIWVVLTTQMSRGLNHALEQASVKGASLICAQQTDRGFPFRYEVTCSHPVLRLVQGDRSLRVSASQLTGLAQVYQLGHIIGFLNGPVIFEDQSAPGSLLTLWSRAEVNGDNLSFSYQRHASDFPAIFECEVCHISSGASVLRSKRLVASFNPHSEGDTVQPSYQLGLRADGLTFMNGMGIDLALNGALTTVMQEDLPLQLDDVSQPAPALNALNIIDLRVILGDRKILGRGKMMRHTSGEIQGDIELDVLDERLEGASSDNSVGALLSLLPFVSQKVEVDGQSARRVRVQVRDSVAQVNGLTLFSFSP